MSNPEDNAGIFVDVKQGDTMVRLAHAHGFRSWEVIYNHPQNAELRRKRPHGHQLHPGDRVYIPPKEIKEFKVGVDRRHTFVLRTLKAYVRVVVGDHRQVYADCPYELEVDGKKYTGRTGDDGLVVQQVPADSQEGILKVWPADNQTPVTWTIKLGHLDPVDTEGGVKDRLRNLGFDPGDTDDDYKNALALFQQQHGLPVTGELDQDTRDKLKEQHLD